MIRPRPRAKYLLGCLTLIISGVALVCWQGARAELSGNGPVSDAVLSATSGKIAFSSDRIAGIFKIFTMNPDGTAVTCLMCNGATDPSGTGSTDPRVGRGPAFSPDGNTIAFVRTDLGEIWLMNFDGTNPRSLTTGSSPSWSPDGARIAFTRSVTTTTPAHNEIFVINVDGSGLGNITNGPDSDMLPSWGAASPAFPQGRIAFRSLRNSNSEIYVIAPTSMSETFLSAPKVNVTNNPAFDSSPEWSPDGRKLAFYSDRDLATGGEDIYTMEMNPSPGLVTRLTTSPNGDSFPTWSPDGAKIAYTSFPGGNLLSEVFVIDAVTGAAISGNITNSPSVDFDLTWGTPRTNAKVVFQKGPNSTSDIYLITPGSGISTGLRKGYHPAFSPDGTKIAFVDNTPGATNGFIRLMDANGGNQRDLAHPVQGFSPTWSPDGSRLAFVRGDFDSVGNDGKGALYVIDMTQGNEGDHETLVPGTLQVSQPSWGSNNRIVYACLQPHPGGGNDVLGIRLTGPIPPSAQIAANPPPITSISGPNLNDRDPAWSADGTAIAFLSTRDYPSFEASEIYVMDAQGNNVRRVTDSSNLFKIGPAWSPDGTKIVFYGGGNLRLVNSDCSKCTNLSFVTSFGSGDSYPNWGTLALASSSPSPTPTPSPSPVVNLEITKTGPTSPVNEDDEFVYNITVKNSNNSNTMATGVKVVDALPNGVRFKRSSNTTCVDSQDIVTCNLPDIAVSDSRSVSLIVSAGAGIRLNQASVTANQHLQPVLSNIVKTTVKYDNDNFAKARQISGNFGNSFSSNVGATKEILGMPCVDSKGFAISPCEPNHAKLPGHQSVWWKWSPSRAGTVYFSTFGSGFDTSLAAYAVYGGKLTERASNDDYAGVTSRIGFKVSEGDTYYIAVDGYRDSAGDIFLSWTQNPEIKPSPLQARINILDPGFAKLKEVTTGSYNLRIIGTNFNELSQVYVNGLASDSRRPNRSVTPTEINVLLPASDIAKIGPVQIVVCGGSDSGGGCANHVSNARILNVIGYSTFEVAPGEITEVCKLDEAGRSLGMCFKTSATTCPGPGNCQITASLYEAITVADLKARSVGTKFHNIGMGVNNDIEVKMEIDQPPPALSVPVGSVNLNGLLLPPAPGLTTNAGLGLLDYGSTKFTAAQFANSLKLIGNDGGTLIGNDGSTLIGNDGGTIYSRATNSFNYNNALSFITRLIGNDGSTFSARQLAPLIGNDGSTLIGNDGSTLIGNDGGTLVGLDGGTLIAASSFLGLKASFAAQSMGIQAGNLVSPNNLLANLHGVGFVSHNGGDLFSHNGGAFSGILASKSQPLAIRAGDQAATGSFDPNYKGWFVISGSGGSVPVITQTTDSEGNAGGEVSLKFDNTSFPKISDLANTVLTVAADPSIVQFSSTGFTATEGVVSASITVSRTGDISLPLNVRYSTSDGTAQQRTDYKATSGALKFAPGETSKTIVLPIVDDVYSETAETVNIILRNADEGVLGTRNTATLTISDNDSGTPTVNPLDSPSFFVRQHYYDVWDRLPDQPGLDSRIAQINQCGTDVACLNSKRITVSLAFLTDAEFQETGFFIARVFKALLGRQPTFIEFLTDRAKVIAGADLNITKTDFLNEFIYRQMLIDPQLADLTPEQFVDRLNANSGGALTSVRRTALVNGLKGQSASMATVLAEVSDNAVFKQNEYNAAFVTMLYFTLLRRDTDSVYASRLQALNQNNNYPGLVDAFVNSSEYRTRFGISTQSWDAVVLTGSQAEIKTWTSGGRTYAYLKLLFPNAGYRVVNWGQASQSGNNFTGDALVENFSGASVQAVTTTAGMYDLGVLAPGNYNFIFKTSGTTVKTQAFTVAAPPFPANPIDDARQFVKQQYRDFLNREADQAGEDFWTDNITKCNDPARRPAGQTVEQCTLRQRETTSGAFFQSPEFQYTGYYVLRMYRGALGRQPKLSEFIPDALFVGNGIVVGGQLSAAKINQNRADFATQFVNCTDATKYRCAEFKAIYDGLSNQQYVDQLFQTTGVNASAADRSALVNGLNANPATETRASVLQKIVDGTVVLGEGNQQFTTSYGQAFYNSEFTRAFVQLEYFGYMKRDPDEAGYAFWLDKLNSFGGNFVNAEMVLAFISSPEYRSRFGQP